MNTEIEAPAADEDAGLIKLHHSNSTAAQRRRLLGALLHGPVTTIKARSPLDVLHPAGRIQELRDLGFPIDTLWTVEVTDSGRRHRVARYVLPSSVPRHGDHHGGAQ